MTNTQLHAKRELEILVATCGPDPDDRPIIEEFIPEILALCEKFGNSGQSGGSASYVAHALANAIKKLCLQETLAPLTGEHNEWMDVSERGDGRLVYQNNREGGVFKDGKDGKAYYIDAIVFDGDIGGRFTSNAGINGITSAQYIKSFPFKPKTFYIDVIDHRWKDKEETTPDPEGDWWTYSIKDESQLKEVFEYYDKK